MVVVSLEVEVMKACVLYRKTCGEGTLGEAKIREFKYPLVEGDVEEVGDLSLEAMDDEEVAMVDVVFKDAFGALGDESWCFGEGVCSASLRKEDVMS
nr:hypothetical protein [Tanacetum cinerariifolium]